MTNKQRHLIEIPEEVQTAILITRLTDGGIGMVIPKGEPGMMEMMALTYGVFVSLVQSGEAQGISEMNLIRGAVKNSSLEDMRDSFVKMAVLAHMIKDEEASND
jgi:hypothetical protein